MPHHLLLDSGPLNWRIPDGASADGVLDQVRHAMEQGSVIEVAVQTNDPEPKHVKLVVNGAAVGAATIVTL
jgi:hypothetical protein